MPVLESPRAETKLLKNLWDLTFADGLDGKPLELLQYRSNLLGADLRITNFGGGNTSSKFELPDPLSGKPVRVLAVKGSGGDLRSIGPGGFALLYLEKLEQLAARYRGEEYEERTANALCALEEDEMVAYYPLCAFGENRVAASIDTPLHAFLPFPHVDHLHPDWCIALAASANGKRKLDEFNTLYGRRIVWLPWQRGEGKSGLRRNSAWKPWIVYLGRNAAPMLREQHSDYRSDGRVHSGAHPKVAPAGLRRRGRQQRCGSRSFRRGDSSVSAGRRVF
jgi:Class II Aldolase and Adducin N-terminal domain